MPQTIWQILNHLAIWQAHQITLLKGDKSGNTGFNEVINISQILEKIYISRIKACIYY
ncbi:hypothetical protein SAMN05661044_01190 [Olivibacter domesticus]|uniref:Uncharacterized protein n=1 Tax=Olivibacter domesticus TaxID=407022 RepID=A0A1H7K3D8_OLID1|nr:hypothetical protein SAMN05661044_01190 [Olivibacter domesticus]